MVLVIRIRISPLLIFRLQVQVSLQLTVVRRALTPTLCVSVSQSVSLSVSQSVCLSILVPSPTEMFFVSVEAFKCLSIPSGLKVF
jgi:hypothetical protein